MAARQDPGHICQVRSRVDRGSLVGPRGYARGPSSAIEVPPVDRRHHRRVRVRRRHRLRLDTCRPCAIASSKRFQRRGGTRRATVGARQPGATGRGRPRRSGFPSDSHACPDQDTEVDEARIDQGEGRGTCRGTGDPEGRTDTQADAASDTSAETSAETCDARADPDAGTGSDDRDADAGPHARSYPEARQAEA